MLEFPPDSFVGLIYYTVTSVASVAAFFVGVCYFMRACKLAFREQRSVMKLRYQHPQLLEINKSYSLLNIAKRRKLT